MASTNAHSNPTLHHSNANPNTTSSNVNNGAVTTANITNDGNTGGQNPVYAPVPNIDVFGYDSAVALTPDKYRPYLINAPKLHPGVKDAAFSLGDDGMPYFSQPIPNLNERDTVMWNLIEVLLPFFYYGPVEVREPKPNKRPNAAKGNAGNNGARQGQGITRVLCDVQLYRGCEIRIPFIGCDKEVPMTVVFDINEPSNFPSDTPWKKKVSLHVQDPKNLELYRFFRERVIDSLLTKPKIQRLGLEWTSDLELLRKFVKNKVSAPVKEPKPEETFLPRLQVKIICEDQERPNAKDVTEVHLVDSDNTTIPGNTSMFVRNAEVIPVFIIPPMYITQGNIHPGFQMVVGYVSGIGGNNMSTQRYCASASVALGFQSKPKVPLLTDGSEHRDQGGNNGNEGEGADNNNNGNNNSDGNDNYHHHNHQGRNNAGAPQLGPAISNADDGDDYSNDVPHQGNDGNNAGTHAFAHARNDAAQRGSNSGATRRKAPTGTNGNNDARRNRNSNNSNASRKQPAPDKYDDIEDADEDDPSFYAQGRVSTNAPAKRARS